MVFKVENSELEVNSCHFPDKTKITRLDNTHLTFSAVFFCRVVFEQSFNCFPRYSFRVCRTTVKTEHFNSFNSENLKQKSFAIFLFFDKQSKSLYYFGKGAKAVKTATVSDSNSFGRVDWCDLSLAESCSE